MDVEKIKRKRSLRFSQKINEEMFLFREYNFFHITIIFVFIHILHNALPIYKIIYIQKKLTINSKVLRAIRVFFNDLLKWERKNNDRSYLLYITNVSLAFYISRYSETDYNNNSISRRKKSFNTIQSHN